LRHSTTWKDLSNRGCVGSTTFIFLIPFHFGLLKGALTILLVWQDDIEYAKLDGKFEVGNKFILKPKNASAVTIELVKVETNKCFVDLTRFPLAKMYGEHEFISFGDELEIKTTIRVTGLLSFVWRKLVAEKIAADEATQTEQLIKRGVALRNG
jgi:hypothetical protein